MAMLFSFFVAVTVTPWLLLRIARRRLRKSIPTGGMHHEHEVGAMGRFYIRIAKPLLNGRLRSKALLFW